MTPSCHGNCPLESGEFQTKVIEGLTDLRTKMNKLVGVDGNNGDFSELKDMVDSHEVYIQRQKGVGGVIKYIWGAIIGFVTALGAVWIRGK